MQARHGVWSIAVFLGAGLVTVLMSGFVLFASLATRNAPLQVSSADAIVVLTGAENRIQEGLRLLSENKGLRLLISGANPKTSRDEVRRHSRIQDRLFDCCVDIGYLAQDTIGNAVETMQWARQHTYRRLIVVTSSYHMPRSLAEIARVMPEAELIAAPVVPRTLAEQAWWLNIAATRMLLSEYLKLLPAAAKLAASRLVRTLEGDAIAARGDAHPSARLAR